MSDTEIPALAVTGLCKSFGALKAVDEVSFTIPRGQTYGLVGESGCGKSTIVKLILGLHRPDRGMVVVDGTDREALPPRELVAQRRRIQAVFQDPQSSLNPFLKVGSIIAEPLLLDPSLTRADVRERVAEMLRKVGLSPDDTRRYPYEFSGGQCQRIALARALVVGPEILICDEPLSALDVSVQATILNLLRDLQEELHLTCLFVAHNLAAVRWISDSLGVMQAGRLVEEGRTEEVFAAPRHEYTKALLRAIPDPFRQGRPAPAEQL